MPRILLNPSWYNLQILSGRNYLFNYAEAPDTFVECYIKDSMNDKIRQKKKTDIIRQNINPDYNYTMTYSVRRCEINACKLNNNHFYLLSDEWYLQAIVDFCSLAKSLRIWEEHRWVKTRARFTCLLSWYLILLSDWSRWDIFWQIQFWPKLLRLVSTFSCIFYGNRHKRMIISMTDFQ